MALEKGFGKDAIQERVIELAWPNLTAFDVRIVTAQRMWLPIFRTSRRTIDVASTAFEVLNEREAEFGIVRAMRAGSPEIDLVNPPWISLVFTFLGCAVANPRLYGLPLWTFPLLFAPLIIVIFRVQDKAMQFELRRVDRLALAETRDLDAALGFYEKARRLDFSEIPVQPKKRMGNFEADRDRLLGIAQELALQP